MMTIMLTKKTTPLLYRSTVVVLVVMIVVMIAFGVEAQHWTQLQLSGGPDPRGFVATASGSIVSKNHQ